MTARAIALACALVVAAGASPGHARTIGQVIDDATLVASVKAKLTADQLSNLVRIDVGSDGGVVTLSGTVPTAERRDRIVQIASAVNGVKRVVNNIQVRSSAAAESPRTSGQAGTTEATASASPATESAAGPGAMVGEVVNVDHGTGRFTLRTGEGDMMLHFPPAAVAGVQQGDRVRVELVRPGQ